MTNREIVTLQAWWMGQLQSLTQKVIADEEKRQEKAKKNNMKMFGDLSIEKREDIDDLYGYGVITEKKRDKLIDLWESGNGHGGLYDEKINLLTELYQEAKQVMQEHMEVEQ